MDHHPPLFLTQSGRTLPGARRVVTVPAPAAGADLVVKVPGGRLWRVLTGFVTFTASAVVANRFPRLQLLDGGQVFWEGGEATALTAGLTRRYSIAAGGLQATGAVSPAPNQLFMPLVHLHGEQQIVTSTAAIDVGDQWSAMRLLIEELYFDDAELVELEDRIHERIRRLLHGG